MVQALAEKNGIPLSIGDVDMDAIVPAAAEGEGPQPKDVASRVVAHIAHRVPGLRRIEKRLEGKEKRSGILSDLGALGLNLYARNESQINQILSEILSGKMSHKGGGNAARGQTHIDFGTVAPGPNGGSSHA